MIPQSSPTPPAADRSSALVGTAAGGAPRERARFEQLYQAYAGQVLGFLVNRCPTPDDASELAQDVWMKVWRSFTTQFDGAQFRAWVFEITRNVLIDHARRKRPQVTDDYPDVASEEKKSIADAEDLARCLEKLSSDHLTVVRARLAGDSYDQISDRLGIPAGRAMTQFHRAKDQLRQCLSGDVP